MMPRTPFVVAALSLGLAAFSPSTRAADAAAAPTPATLTLDASKPGPVIDKNIYGHFTEHLGHCVYEGIWVGPDSKIPNVRGIRSDVVAALKQLAVPQVRWPGGCFADEYHWRDGIGPRESRPAMINTHWGGVVENNHFGTHEFLDFCEQVGADPYICLNVGSGTVQEAMEWVEYMTSDADSPLTRLRAKNGREKPWRVPYLAIGNESWGCGGNMTPQFYADNFRRYNTFVKNYVRGAEGRITRIACGPDGANYEWTETLMKGVGNRMQGLALHNYTLPTGSWRGSKGSATQFGEEQYFSTLVNAFRMEELVAKHSAIMDKYDPQKRIALVVDEWGVWTDVEPGTNPGFLYQQNSLRDAIVAAVHLHIFQAHADRVTMANIAQMINVLQSVILTDKEKILLTPTYWVFEMFKVHHGATSLPLALAAPDYTSGGKTIPAVSASASRGKDGRIHLSLANCDATKPIALACSLTGVTAKTVSGRILTAPAINSINTFAAPHTVEPAAFQGAKLDNGALKIELPAKSIVVLELN
jgi:alpha-N-arabinofuranosidase